MKLALAETFCSIQGEGHLTGKRMFFIRFAGCSVSSCFMHPSRSNLCDTDWSVSQVLRSRQEIEDLALDAVRLVGASGWVCITGGEPTHQEEALYYLSGAITRAGGKVHIQTSGVRLIDCPWDWITVSPKTEPWDLAQTFGQELKLVLCGQTDDEIRAYYDSTRFWNYYLQPLWTSGMSNADETVAAIHRLNDAGQPWELSLQTHKFIGVR